MFGFISVNLDGQLKQVFKCLIEMGYLIKLNLDKQIYLGIGKIEYFYEMLCFIDEIEVLSLFEQVEVVIL